jgi:peptidoglycan/xylan/chitin deacetylase (PgdA/CDA1 family)
MRFPQGKPKALTLSYDDGVEQDARLVELMKKHGVKGTFNVSYGEICPPGKVYEAGRYHRPMTLEQLKHVFDWDGIEIAVHGWHHPHFEHLVPSVAMEEIIEDRLGLEKEFGGVIRGMAYPFGTYNDQVVEILKQTGIRYARTTKSTKQFDLPTDWLRLHPTVRHGSPSLMELTDEFLNLSVVREPKLFYLWGHTFEFDLENNWNVIEEFFEKAAGREEIWYATNIEIYEYTQAFERLIYSCDGKRVFNPSAMDVWVAYQEKNICIPAGQTIILGK